MALDDLTPPALDEAHNEVTPTGWARWSEMLVAIGVIAIGIIILVETQQIRVVRAMAQVSPRAIPQIVGTGLVLAGLWYAWDIWRHPHVLTAGEDDEDVDIEAPTNWMVLFWISVGLLVSAILMRPAGFIIASAILFTVASTAMGSRKIVLNAVIGLVLGSVVFFVFDGWLGVRLPDGILEPLLD